LARYKLLVGISPNLQLHCCRDKDELIRFSGQKGQGHNETKCIFPVIDSSLLKTGFGLHVSWESVHAKTEHSRMGFLGRGSKSPPHQLARMGCVVSYRQLPDSFGAL